MWTYDSDAGLISCYHKYKMYYLTAASDGISVELSLEPS